MTLSMLLENILIAFCFLACVLIEGLASLCVTWVFSLSRAQLEIFSLSQDSRERRIYKIMKHPETVVVALFMQGVLGSVLLQNLCSAIFDSSHNLYLKVVLPMIVVTIFAELIPKIIAISYPDKIAKHLVSSFLLFEQVFFYPSMLFIRLMDRISLFLNFFIFPEKPPTIFEQIKAVESGSESIISSEEKSILESILSFCSMRAKDIMIPRQQIKFFDLNDDISVFYEMISVGNTKEIAIARSSILDLIGVIKFSDLLIYSNKIKTSQDLLNFIKAPIYIPDSLPCKIVLEQIDTSSSCFVVNEYGLIVGQITKMCLLRKFFKQTGDSLHEQFVRVGDGIVIDAVTHIDKVEKLLSFVFSERNGQSTILGLINFHVFEPLHEGFILEVDGGEISIQILSIESNRVQFVYLYKN